MLSDNKQVDQLRQQGNDAFKTFLYQEAILKYSAAIVKLHSLQESNLAAILLANRAQCHIKLQNYGLALQDSQKAITADKNYIKAYYRKGSSLLILGKFQESLQAFSEANTVSGGSNPDVNSKITEVKRLMIQQKKQQKAKMFAEAISGGGSTNSDGLKQLSNIKDLQEPVNYSGPIIKQDTQITPKLVQQLMQLFKNQKKLPKKYLLELLKRALQTFQKERTLMEHQVEDGEITVCGDVHGQYYDLINIFKINGEPSPKNSYLFNGDFVDRGSFSVEVINTLLAWKVCFPNNFFMNRGNHEAEGVNKIYGFEGQVLFKYDKNVYEIYSNIFRALPLATIINNSIFVCHGGLFEKDGVLLKDIKDINRFSQPPTSGIFSDLLWADPMAAPGRQPSKRGIGMSFGPDVTRRFLEENKLSLVIRSHQVRPNGFERQQDGQLITVFSAPNYCDQMRNQGAFIRINKQSKTDIKTFSWVQHPSVPVMAYANRFSGLY